MKLIFSCSCTPSRLYVRRGLSRPYIYYVCFQQAPVILNVPSQLQGNLQAQPQSQPVYVQQHQQSFVPQTNLVNSNAGKAMTVQQSPRSDELRSYLSRSHTWSNPSQNYPTTDSIASQSFTTLASVVSGSNLATVPNISQTLSRAHEQINCSRFSQVPPNNLTPHVHETPPPVISTAHYPTTSQVSAEQHTIAQSLPTPERPKQSALPQQEPKVSSPGLAFLAQVSSLTSGNRSVPSHIYGSAGAIEEYVSHQGSLFNIAN